MILLLLSIEACAGSLDVVHRLHLVPLLALRGLAVDIRHGEILGTRHMKRRQIVLVHLRTLLSAGASAVVIRHATGAGWGGVCIFILLLKILFIRCIFLALHYPQSVFDGSSLHSWRAFGLAVVAYPGRVVGIGEVVALLYHLMLL